MKKLYYVFLNNHLYYDNFTRKQKLKLNKILTDADIIQTYKENNTIFIQLEHNNKINNIVYEKGLNYA